MLSHFDWSNLFQSLRLFTVSLYPFHTIQIFLFGATCKFSGFLIENTLLFFISDVHSGIPPMNASQLDALKDIKNITGKVNSYQLSERKKHDTDSVK